MPKALENTSPWGTDSHAFSDRGGFEQAAHEIQAAFYREMACPQTAAFEYRSNSLTGSGNVPMEGPSQYRLTRREI